MGKIFPKEVKNPTGSPSPYSYGFWTREDPPSVSADPTAAELKLKDVRDTTVSISTAPQNRPESPPTGVTAGLCPICSRGMGLLHPPVSATVCCSTGLSAGLFPLFQMSGRFLEDFLDVFDFLNFVH